MQSHVWVVVSLILLACKVSDAFVHIPVKMLQPSGSWRTCKGAASGRVGCVRMGNDLDTGGVQSHDARLNDPFKSVSEAKKAEKGMMLKEEEPEMKGQREKVDLITYIFGKPGELDRDLAMLGTSRRRFLSINAASVVDRCPLPPARPLASARTGSAFTNQTRAIHMVLFADCCIGR